MALITEPIPYEEAARIVAEKQIMSKAAFDTLCDELKARAFTVAGLEDLRMVQEIRDAIAELPMGTPWEDVKRQVADKLEQGGFSEKAADYRATLLLRHHGFAVYAQENYRELQEMKDAFPYWKYQTMGDEKVRSSHAALDGLILPADDPFWRDHFPPWEWNCRCQVVGVTQEEYDAAQTAGSSSFDPTDPDAKAAGWKLPPAALDRLHNGGQLDDGSGHPANVARTGSFHFDPSGPGLDMAEIEKRYNPADWARFKANMEAEKLADGRSVWDWANGVKASGSAGVPPAKNAGEPSASRQAGRTVTPRQDADEAGMARVAKIRVGEDGSVALQRPTAADAGVTAATREKPIAEAMRDAAKLDAGLQKELQAALGKIAGLPRAAKEKAMQELAEALRPHAERRGKVAESINSLSRKKAKTWEEAKRFIEGAVNLEHLGKPVGLVELHPRETRSRYAANTNRIGVSQHGSSSSMVHEFGHHLEATNPHFQERCAEFLRYRAESSEGEAGKAQSLRRLVGGQYGAEERAIPDKFDDPYCGKVYSRHAGPQPVPTETMTRFGIIKSYDVASTELLSMGLARLHFDPVDFFSRDPEYYHFIMNLLRGAI